MRTVSLRAWAQIALLAGAAGACGGESLIGLGPAEGDGGAGGTAGTMAGSGAAAGTATGSGAAAGTATGSGATAGTTTGGGARGGAGGFSGNPNGAGGGVIDVPCGDSDITTRLKANCSRTGCHNALDHFSELDLSDPGAGGLLVDRRAVFGDISCAAPGEVFRACDPPPDACPKGALLVDSQHPEQSWMILKMRDAEGCGDLMPLAPGNSTSNGWGPEAQTCIEDWVYALAAAAR